MRIALVLSFTFTACTGIVGVTPGLDAGPADIDGGPIEASGCDVQALLSARCSSCHGSPTAQGAPVSFVSLSTLRSPSLSKPTQTFAERCVARMKDVVIPMPPAPDVPATAGEVAVLEGWLAAGMPDCTTSTPDGGPITDGGSSETSPNLIPQGELFMCSGAVSDAPTRLRRLNRWEWTRNVGGAVTRSWTGFSFYDNPFDPSAGEAYSTWATDESIDEATVEIFLPIVSEAGPPWAGPYTGSNRLERLRTDQSLRCMYEDAHPAPACVRHYLSEFLEHGVLFRPARTDELDRLQAFATAVLGQETTIDSDSRTHSITRISNAAWLTTGALFREERGDRNADGGRVNLTGWELAQQLTYAVGRRGPGATPSWVYPDYSAEPEGHMADIADAARDGGIFDDAKVDALFRKYAGGTDLTRFDLVQDFNPGERNARGQYWMSDGVTGFFREWLGYANVAEVFKERPEATSKFDDGATSPYRAQLAGFGNQMNGFFGDEPTLVQQMDDLIGRVVVADQDVLKTLLTTRQWYLPSTDNAGELGNNISKTTQMYGTEQLITQDRTSRWFTLPASERAGVLTHPAWLGAHGGNFEDDPSVVHRGKWVRENLLCGWVPPLSSVRVVAQVGPHAPNKNARRRLEEATAGTQCQGCHALMNPLGLPFETYNQSGYLRAKDHAVDGGFGPPDGTAMLSGMPDPALDGPVTNAIDFSSKLADSAYVKRCFVRQAFRYYMGRAENRSDACTLTKMEAAYDTNHGSFLSMVSALMTSDTWKSRRVPGEGE